MEEKTCALVDELFGLVPIFRKKFLKPLENSSSLNLTPTQLQALFIIYYGPEMSMSEISEELQVSKQQLTKIINCLEESNCVIRYQDEKSRRNVRVKITDLGKKTCEDVKKTLVELEMKLFQSLDDDECLNLTSSIHTIRDLLESEK